MFYYCVFITMASGMNQPFYQSTVFSLSAQEQAPMAKMLQAYRNILKQPDSVVTMLHCRIITPDDYQELLKMGVRHFKLDFKPQLVKQGE